jgi:hypothetical protein
MHLSDGVSAIGGMCPSRISLPRSKAAEFRIAVAFGSFICWARRCSQVMAYRRPSRFPSWRKFWIIVLSPHQGRFSAARTIALHLIRCLSRRRATPLNVEFIHADVERVAASHISSVGTPRASMMRTAISPQRHFSVKIHGAPAQPRSAIMWRRRRTISGSRLSGSVISSLVRVIVLIPFHGALGRGCQCVGTPIRSYIAPSSSQPSHMSASSRPVKIR